MLEENLHGRVARNYFNESYITLKMPGISFFFISQMDGEVPSPSLRYYIQSVGLFHCQNMLINELAASANTTKTCRWSQSRSLDQLLSNGNSHIWVKIWFVPAELAKFQSMYGKLDSTFVEKKKSISAVCHLNTVSDSSCNTFHSADALSWFWLEKLQFLHFFISD